LTEQREVAGPPRIPERAGRTRHLLLVVLAVGLGLRLIGLGSSFWIDEVDSVIHCFRLPIGTLISTYPSENQHPLYSLLAHGSVALFGEHEWSVRLPAALLGVASLAAVARLGSQLLDARSGLLAALLLAVSYHHVWFSQNARGYTGVLLFSTLATSELLELLRRPARGPALRYALWFALALYTHLTAAFAFAGHALVWLAVRLRPPAAREAPWVDCEPLPPPRASGAALAAMAGGALAALLLYAPMADDVVRAFTARVGQATVAVTRVTEWTRPGWALAQAAGSLGSGGAALAGVALAGALAATGLVSLWRNGRRTVLLLHLLPVPVALAFLLSMQRHLYPRFFFFLAGFAAIAVVRGASISGGWLACRLPSCREQRARDFGIAVTLLVAAASCLSLSRNYELPKQDFTGARDLVEALAGRRDARVAVGPAKLALPGYYAPAWSVADSAAELAAIRAAAPRTWVVYTKPDQLRAARPDLFAALEAEFEIVRELPGTLGDGAVYVARAPR